MATTARNRENELLRVDVTRGPDRGKRFFLKPQRRALIGRSSAADVQLTDGSVSTKHCLLRHEGALVFIEDLGSRNGTKLNGLAIKTCALDEDALLEAGKSAMTLTWVASEAEAPSGIAPPPSSDIVSRGDLGPTMRIPRSHAERIADSKFMSTEPLQEFRRAQMLVGKNIDVYKLLDLIGMGPLGYAYHVQDTATQQDMALKLIPRADVRSPELLTQFLSGCRKDLHVLGATRFLATGMIEDYAYIVMEYAKGRNLQSLLDDGKKLTPAEAMRIAGYLCDTLHAAHAFGVFHGDVKPASIVMREDGTPLLLDLGLPRRVDMEGRGLLRRDDRLGNLIATAPELTVEGGVVDARTDVYSLAAALFYVISGQPPIVAPTRAEFLREIRSVAPPLLNTLRTEAPQPLAEALARALEKEPAKRFSNMLDFAAALKQSVPGPQ